MGTGNDDSFLFLRSEKQSFSGRFFFIDNHDKRYASSSRSLIKFMKDIFRQDSHH